MKPVTRFALLITALVLAVGSPGALRAAAEGPSFEEIYGSTTDLESAAERYRKIVEAGGWPTVASGPTLEPGASDPRVADLRQLLVATGDLDEGDGADSAASAENYSSEVATAVENFQRRHHIAVDGLIGPNTLEALQVPAEKRLAQIEAALETRKALAERGLTGSDDPLAILINLPEYRLHLLESGRQTLTMDVAIGQPGWKTPILREVMETVIINPYWYVPIEIIAAEIAPKVQDDPSYLASAGLEIAKEATPDAEIVDAGEIDWANVSADQADSFPYYLRHRPGAQNPLGRVKFRLPNREDIYLHDTPADAVFDKSDRAVSHGCIRLERPFELAERLATEIDGWDAERMRSEIENGTHRHLALVNHIPVESFYLVAWADSEGTVFFTDTPYGLSGPEQVVSDPEVAPAP